MVPEEAGPGVGSELEEVQTAEALLVDELGAVAFVHMQQRVGHLADDGAGVCPDIAHAEGRCA